MELAENPTEEVAAMHHLQCFVEGKMRREKEKENFRALSAMERSHSALPTDLLSEEENLSSVT